MPIFALFVWSTGTVCLGTQRQGAGQAGITHASLPPVRVLELLQKKKDGKRNGASLRVQLEDQLSHVRFC